MAKFEYSEIPLSKTVTVNSTVYIKVAIHMLLYGYMYQVNKN